MSFAVGLVIILAPCALLFVLWGIGSCIRYCRHPPNHYRVGKPSKDCIRMYSDV